MKKLDQIRGAGGGGKGGGGGGTARVPVEAADSLRSKQFARVIDLVSEGEVFGLVDGLKSVYLDDTPIQNADGSYNFEGVTLVTRNGTQSQDYIPGFPSSEAETSVAAEIKAATPIVRSITNANENAARVTLSVPALKFQDPSTADISGTSVQIAIDVQANGGGYVQKLTDTISGKASTTYQRAYRIELTGSAPWDIRVRRITADSAQSNLQNATWWGSYTEIIDAKLRYPNSALCALMVDAQQFRAIPRRGYEMKGLLVRIPSNYNPTTRAYTGVWDGTFSIAWTDNPAWCFYDLLTAERYGLGAFLSAGQVDKWTLYQIAQYCDTLVPDGFGGMEPRFTCNLYLQTREEAYTVINNFASIFRAMVYWAGGAITAVQDAPSDPVALFTPANVIGGQFNYEGSSAKQRHTVALVTWNDPADRYKQKIEYVEDEGGIGIYGIVQTEIIAMGCTSRGMAHRAGDWLLQTERTETETVNFRAGLEGLAAAPGEIIQTSDPVRAGQRMGGRITSATVASVVLDASITIESGKTYTLWAVLPDGSVESRTVTTAPSTTATLALAPDFTAAPQAMSIWVLAASDLVPEMWRVLAVEEVDDTQAQITALAYNPGKYAAVEQNLKLEPLQISTLDATPGVPINITVSEALYIVSSSVVGNRITVGWSGSAQYYELQWRIVDGNWTTLSTPASSIDIQPANEGNYEFKLVAINAIGRRSAVVTATKTIYGLRAIPQNVTGLGLAAIGGMAHMVWDPAADVDKDVIVGGHMHLRHTPEIALPDWNSAVDIGSQIPGTATTATLPLLAGTYLAKWFDSGGRESATATGVSTTAPNVMALNVVETVTEHAAFAGQKTGVAKVAGGIVLDSAETIGDQLGLMSTWPAFSQLGGGIAPSGEYLFAGSVDLGYVQTSRLTAALTAHGFDALDLISQRGLVSAWPSVVGELIADVGCKIYVRTTNDNPAGSPTWGGWKEFVVGDYSARAFQFKAVLYSDYSAHNVLVSQLAVTVDMPDRIESSNDVPSGAGTYTVTYTLPFRVSPAVAITAQDMATGDYYELTNKTTGGLDITFRNAAAAPISKTFDWMAKGY